MISMAAREAFNGAPGPVYLEIPRDVLDREVDLTKAVIPQARPLPRLDPFDRRSARYREAGRHPGQLGAAGDPVRPAGLDRRAATRRPSRCCAASTFPAISTAAAAGCCRPAIRITSIGRAARPSPTPM